MEVVKLDIPAFEIRQWGYGEGVGAVPLYVTSMNMRMLSRMADIDRWTKNNREGYQRGPLESRLRPGKGTVTGYILNELGVFPTSILLGVREAITFKPERAVGANVKFGMLTIPDNTKLWIIDGQHRLEALKRAMGQKPELEDYPVPVSILNLRNKFEEMLIFYIVNSRQKGIPTSIAYRHLQSMIEKVRVEGKYKWIETAILTPKDERKGVAAMIVDFLNENEDSPFYDKICYPGEEFEKGRHLLKDEVLIRYISKILVEKTFSATSPEDMAFLLIDYWGALKELYPPCFGPESERYTLLKHTGVASFTYLFPYVYGICARMKDISKEKMMEILSILKQEMWNVNELHPDFRRPIDESWWSHDHGPSIARATSEANFTFIANSMARKIDIGMKLKK